MAGLVRRKEFRVFLGSPFIGMKVKEIEEKYGITVLHLHDPVQKSKKELAPHWNRLIKERFSIEVEGEWKNVERIYRDSLGVYESYLREYMSRILI